MGVSKNRGTPKPSILIMFSIINHPFWGTTIFGNIQMVGIRSFVSHLECNPSKLIRLSCTHFGASPGFLGLGFSWSWTTSDTVIPKECSLWTLVVYERNLEASTWFFSPELLKSLKSPRFFFFPQKFMGDWECFGWGAFLRGTSCNSGWQSFRFFFRWDRVRMLLSMQKGMNKS